MAWWVWLIIAVVVYLVLCLVPWLLFRLFTARLERKGGFVTEILPRINALVDAERHHTSVWPEEPRPGRYEEIDREALRLLSELRDGLSRVNEIADRVAAYATPVVSVGRAFLLGAFGPMAAARKALSERSDLDSQLESAERTAAALAEQQSEAAAVPDRLQADLVAAQAEIRRLYALWEAEIQAGTQDIQALGDGLALVDNAMSATTETVRTSGADEQLGTVLRAEQQLAMATETIEQAERELEAIRTQRTTAQEAAETAHAAVSDVSARWVALQDQGVKDPSVAARVSELGKMVATLDATLGQATPSAFEQATERAQEVKALGSSVAAELEALKESMTKSAETVSENVVLLDRARAVLAESTEAMPGVTFDVSTGQIREGEEILTQSQSALQSGTLHGYQTAATLAEQAREKLQEALERVTSTVEAVQKLNAERDAVGDAARAALRERAATLASEWEVYGRHWHPGRQGALAGALSSLDTADAAWAALPEAFRSEGILDQSHLAELQGLMQSVTGGVEASRGAIDSLESELTAIISLREQVETGVAALETETLPALVDRRDKMLPELAERYDNWLLLYHEQRAALADPAQMDYERAAADWLPQVTSEAQSILSAYEGDLVHYGKQLEEARRRLERSWQRLQRLEPQQPPLPQEDINKLTEDIDSWMATGKAEAANPAVLSGLVTHQASDLERRIDLARRQISEGRQALSSLERQFQQIGQSLQKTRASLRALQNDTQWQQIKWVLGSGEETWERALAAEASSKESESLEMAVNEMQRAINVGQEAQQIYAGSEQQLRSAVDRLNREFRAATNNLDRAQRRANQLRQEGPSEELDALDERISSAMSLVSMAQNASNFEDALRHLTAAQEELGRS